MVSDSFTLYTALGVTFALAVATWARAGTSDTNGAKAAYSIAGIGFFFATLVSVMELVTQPKPAAE